MKVLVCGGRDYADRDWLFTVLDHLHEESYISEVIHGAASGADTLAGEWAQFRGISVRAFPADWERYKYRAGPVRNAQMLREGMPDMILAFPGGRGTAHMVGLARHNNLIILKVLK